MLILIVITVRCQIGGWKCVIPIEFYLKLVSSMCCHGNLFYAISQGFSPSFYGYLETREIEHVKNFTVCIWLRNDYTNYSCILFKYWAKSYKSISNAHLKTQGENVRKLRSGERLMNLG